MEITTYRDLEMRDEFLPLFQHAFWWSYYPQEFEKIIKVDPRLQNSPVGYVATKHNHLTGFVGVMDITTRTLEGIEEKVGEYGESSHTQLSQDEGSPQLYCRRATSISGITGTNSLF